MNAKRRPQSETGSAGSKSPRRKGQWQPGPPLRGLKSGDVVMWLAGNHRAVFLRYEDERKRRALIRKCESGTEFFVLVANLSLPECAQGALDLGEIEEPRNRRPDYGYPED